MIENAENIDIVCIIIIFSLNMFDSSFKSEPDQFDKDVARGRRHCRAINSVINMDPKYVEFCNKNRVLVANFDRLRAIYLNLNFEPNEKEILYRDVLSKVDAEMLSILTYALNKYDELMKAAIMPLPHVLALTLAMNNHHTNPQRAKD